MIVDSKKSWCITGAPGTGKSKLTVDILKKIKNAIALAPTHKACRVINGQTLHKFLSCVFTSKQSLLNKIKDVEYIVVDEISMVKEIFYKVFMMIKKKRPDVKFIMVGDYNQLEVVKDRVEDCDYENSLALFEICDGNKLSLLKCRRSNDELFNLTKFETIGDLKATQFNRAFTKRHICFTNKKRIEINSIMMKQYKEELEKQKKKAEPVYIKKLTYDPNSQDVALLAGMPIIARINNQAMGIANNESFVIKEVDSDIMKIKGEDNRVMTISTKAFSRLFFVAYAITTHKSQGQTFNHAYTIHEWERFSNKMKYVALTRATDKALINII
jgi:ATP-dependent exoDNAse (exonuclease V) alpha subunit